MRTRLFMCVLLVLAPGGCQPGTRRRLPSDRQPRGLGDSLAKLARRLLEDPDPVRVYQAITCEHVRLGRLYGPYKADSIGREVEDTIYTRQDHAALRRVDAKLANRVFRSDCGHPLGSISSPAATRPHP